MKAGQLIEVIEIERFTSTVNEAGTPVQEWAAVCTLRAEKVEQSTTEYMRNVGTTDEEVVVFRTRYFDGITNADRVIWQGDAFNIKQIALIDRRKGLELRCTRIPE